MNVVFQSNDDTKKLSYCRILAGNQQQELKMQWKLTINLSLWEKILYALGILDTKCKLEIVPQKKCYVNCFSIEGGTSIDIKNSSSAEFTVIFSPGKGIEDTKISYGVQLYHNDEFKGESKQCVIDVDKAELCSECEKSIEANLSFTPKESPIIIYDHMFDQVKNVADMKVNNNLTNCVLSSLAVSMNGVGIPFDLLQCDGSKDRNVLFVIIKNGVVMQSDDAGRFNIKLDSSNVYCIQVKYSNLEKGELSVTYSVQCDLCGKRLDLGVKTLTIPIDYPSDYVRLQVQAIERNATNVTEVKELSYGSKCQLSEVRLDGISDLSKSVIISNQATACNSKLPNLGLRVRNVTLGLRQTDRDRVVNNQYQVGDSEERVLSPGGEFRLDFNFKQLGNVKVQDNCGYLDGVLNLCFEYKEERAQIVANEQGFNKWLVRDDGWQTFRADLLVRIHRIEPSYWYSVDFGTSAVVAFRYRHSDNNFDILNLKQKKTALMLENYNGKNEEGKRKDVSEPTENLISSSLMFNYAAVYQKTSVSSEELVVDANYKDQLLWFSPTSSMEVAEHQLPCLKNMMGHNKIPQIPIYKIVEGKLDNLTVNDIMKSAYTQLFKYYINNNAPEQNVGNADDRDIESLVLTVPNTFTPVHIKQMRDIVKSNLPTLRDDKFEVVSESDSVLCSYLSSRAMQGNFSEYVLVYDMGAGTLDLTYARCIFNNTEKSIEIISKVGINKAGNYIDYMLGEILKDLISKIEKGQGTWTQNIDRMLSLSPDGAPDYNAMKTYKNYLRNVLKPMLGESADTKLSPYKIHSNDKVCDLLGEITVGDILGHDLFKEFIDICTIKVIDYLFAGLSTCKVDVVLLSGRSVSIPAIQKSLKRCMESKLSGNNKVVNYKKMAADGMYNLKTVVARGAINYVYMNSYDNRFNIKRRKVYGCYGVLLKRQGSPVEWHRLIDRNTRPTAPIVAGIELEGVINNLNVNGIDMVCLCHTYSLQPLQEAIAGNYDSISIIHEHKLVAQHAPIIGVELQISDNNELKYTISGAEIKNLYPRDDYKNESLRKSLWPVIYNMN